MCYGLCSMYGTVELASVNLARAARHARAVTILTLQVQASEDDRFGYELGSSRGLQSRP